MLSELRNKIAGFVVRLVAGTDAAARFASVTARVHDDDPGWRSGTGGDHERDAGEAQQLYADALEAWRKNPLAWRIVAILRNFILGDGIAISSEVPEMAEFIRRFWGHRKNMLEHRLEEMIDEWTRSGDLFIVLFRNGDDGMSYVRFLTKDEIQDIETAENDRELELVYWQAQPGGEPRPWYGPNHPRAVDEDAIVLHYKVNAVIGALMGEGDLVTILVWLQRYSRMLEDRVRLHWAVRAFLWMVTVPAGKVKAKAEQYRRPPDAGSIIVKDPDEAWEAVSPGLRGADAQHDIRAVLRMILAGAGFPEHWMSETSQANLATARAAQVPTERHLRRRQNYFVYMLQDIIYHAYQRAAQVGRQTPLEETDYSKLFAVQMADISREDNKALAEAAHQLTLAMAKLQGQLGGDSPSLRRLVLQLVLKFAGEPQPADTLDKIMKELRMNPSLSAASSWMPDEILRQNGKVLKHG